MITTTISDMETACNDADVRPLSDGANIDIRAGLISGSTFTGSVYNWGCDINFASDIYLRGSSGSLFIFQTTGNVVVGSSAKVTHSPGRRHGNGKSKASSIDWPGARFVDAGTTSHLERSLI